MKYFVKHLPIEGAVQESDRAFFRPDGSLVIRQELPPGVAQNLSLNDCQAAGTFLCSPEGDGIGFKIIGEISPNAGWLKEGDVLDGSQILGYFEEDGEPGYVMDITDQQTDGVDYYQIQGPCGHFH